MTLDQMQAGKYIVIYFVIILRQSIAAFRWQQSKWGCYSVFPLAIISLVLRISWTVLVSRLVSYIVSAVKTNLFLFGVERIWVVAASIDQLAVQCVALALAHRTTYPF